MLGAGVGELPEAVDDLRRRLARQVHALQRRALDLVGIAADRRTVLAEDLVLVVDPRRPAEDIRGVGVLGDEPERLPFATAADHDRRPGPGQRLG